MKLVAMLGAAAALLLVVIIGTGVLLVRGAATAATAALEWAQPAIESALPRDLAPDVVADRLDRAIAVAREGRVNGAVVRDALFWLPLALLDGQLDAAEVAELGARLDRIVEPAAPATGAGPADSQG
jgi:hypothetical protein